MLKRRAPACGRGFTLVEMIIAIAILAITIGLGLPSYKVWIQNTKLRNAAESLVNGLQLARAEAVRRNAPVAFTLGAGSAWTVGCVSAGPSCPALIQSRAQGDGSSAAVTVAAPDGNSVRFDAFGRMTQPAPAAGFAVFNVDLNPAVLSASLSRDLRVIVDIGGSVRMCDPNVGTGDPRAC